MSSLTVLKILVGILLLHGASSYCDDRKKSADSSNEGSPSSLASETRSSSDITVGGEGVRLRATAGAAGRKPGEHRKQRSLSEVERYTPVNNRIV